MNNLTIYSTIGIPCSGKSTWINKYANDNDLVVVNPDSIRGRLSGGNEGDQSRNNEVFKIAAKELMNELIKGNSVCYDACCYNSSNRKMVEDIAVKTNSNIEWHYFPITLDTAIKRQETRTRKVPLHVMEKMINGMSTPTTGIIVKH